MRRLVVAATAVAVLVSAAAADASGLRLGGRNPNHGSSKKSTRLVGKLKGPALSVRNLGGGPAFTFMTTGLLGGTISVGKGGDSAVPFTTNATGVAKGLNADRLDGHDASDFLLAGGAVDASTLGGHASSFFLPASGKASNANLLDGLDSTAFLAANATAVNSNQLGGHAASFFLPTTGTAADSNELGGQPPSAYLASSTRISLSQNPLINDGDPLTTIGSGSGFTFKASCAIVSTDTEVHLRVANTTGTAYVGVTLGGALTQTTIGTADEQEVFTGSSGGTPAIAGVVPLSVSVARDDGTAYQGIVTLGVLSSGHCFASGSLSS